MIIIKENYLITQCVFVGPLCVTFSQWRAHDRFVKNRIFLLFFGTHRKREQKNQLKFIKHFRSERERERPGNGLVYCTVIHSRRNSHREWCMQ